MIDYKKPPFDGKWILTKGRLMTDYLRSDEEVAFVGTYKEAKARAIEKGSGTLQPIKRRIQMVKEMTDKEVIEMFKHLTPRDHAKEL